MNNTMFSILLVAVGLLIGFIIAFVINGLKVRKILIRFGQRDFWFLNKKFIAKKG